MPHAVTDFGCSWPTTAKMIKVRVGPTRDGLVIGYASIMKEGSSIFSVKYRRRSMRMGLA